MIFGPVHYGFQGIYNWQGELSATPNGANWFPDKYLPALKTASDTYGKPLVDVYDFHWYSEATDGTTRVTNLTGSNLTDAQVQAIVQSPRSLWDPTFTRKFVDHRMTCWANRSSFCLGLQAKIDAEFPGTRISITEYENGGDNHIAGTIAQADNLGIFGSQGVFAATLWPLRQLSLTFWPDSAPSADSMAPPPASATPRYGNIEQSAERDGLRQFGHALIQDASCSSPSTASPRHR